MRSRGADFNMQRLEPKGVYISWADDVYCSINCLGN